VDPLALPQHLNSSLCTTIPPNATQRTLCMYPVVLMLIKRCVITVAAAVRGETCRSFSLPENRLTANSPQQQQPTSSVSSSSLITSIEEKCLRTSIDSGAASPCTVDRTPDPADVKSALCDVIVTSQDVQSPVRSNRPTRLDLAAVHSVQASKVDSSPDDRKQLVGILLNRSPRRANSMLGSLGFVVVL